jgi:hypothetical protein
MRNIAQPVNQRKPSSLVDVRGAIATGKPSPTAAIDFPTAA